jgi:small-conductance mechanosensitive channel
MSSDHKFAVGDKVRVNGIEGVIHAIIPFTFIAPAYDVRVTKTIIIPVSERSIEKIEQQESEIVNDR